MLKKMCATSTQWKGSSWKTSALLRSSFSMPAGTGAGWVALGLLDSCCRLDWLLHRLQSGRSCRHQRVCLPQQWNLGCSQDVPTKEQRNKRIPDSAKIVPAFVPASAQASVCSISPDLECRQTLSVTITAEHSSKLGKTLAPELCSVVDSERQVAEAELFSDPLR